MVGAAGLEPTTSRSQSVHSNPSELRPDAQIAIVTGIQRNCNANGKISLYLRKIQETSFITTVYQHYKMRSGRRLNLIKLTSVVRADESGRWSNLIHY